MALINTTDCELFKLFENKEWISADQMPELGDYIYGCLNGGYRCKKMYGYSNYYTKCKIVIRWKKEKGLELKTKLAEVICENILVHFLEDKNHTLDKCNCGNAWWESIMAESCERFGFQIFKDYENGQFIYKHEFRTLTNYLCGNVNADYSPNRWYYSDWYNESSNLYMVAR